MIFSAISSLTAILLSLTVVINDVSYNYYQNLRIWVFSSSLILLFNDGSSRHTKYMLIIIGLVFNPILKLNLPYTLWIIIDSLAALFFIYMSLKDAYNNNVNKNSDRVGMTFIVFFAFLASLFFTIENYKFLYKKYFETNVIIYDKSLSKSYEKFLKENKDCSDIIVVFTQESEWQPSAHLKKCSSDKDRYWSAGHFSVNEGNSHKWVIKNE